MNRKDRVLKLSWWELVAREEQEAENGTERLSHTSKRFLPWAGSYIGQGCSKDGLDRGFKVPLRHLFSYDQILDSPCSICLLSLTQTCCTLEMGIVLTRYAVGTGQVLHFKCVSVQGSRGSFLTL